jgi:glycosyltransferase involved in cell wall biosynthesis
MNSKNRNLKISIITVVKNSEDYIENNILSLLGQTYKNYEHIIINGNSTDNTKKIIDKYYSKISKIIHEPDFGLYDAMNKGINLSTGDVIGILNADDYFYPHALQIVNNYFQRNENIDFLFGSVNKYNKIYSGYYPIKLYWTFGFYSSHSVGFFIKKKSQFKLGFYNTKYKYSADYDLFYRMIIKERMKGSSTKKNEVVGYFRSGGLSERIKYIDYLNENTQIRLDNKQNFIIVKIIHYLRYLRRLRLIFNQKKL